MFAPPTAMGTIKHLPLPKGKYSVGCTDIMTGPGAKGSFVRLFYPTETSSDKTKWSTWIPEQAYLDAYGSLYKPWSTLFKYGFQWFFGPVYIPAAENAPILQHVEQKPWPVVVFSHGLTGCRTSYSTICTELTSRGFVVASVEHRDRSAAVSYYYESDETGNESGKERNKQWLHHNFIPPSERQFPIRKSQLDIRTAEVKQVLDLVQKLNEGAPVLNLLDTDFKLMQLSGQLDVSKPVIIGHSFGGATVIQACAEDSRFHAGVVLDSWMFPLKESRQLHLQIRQPLLFVNMEGFQFKTNLAVMKWFEKDHTDDGTGTRKVTTIKGTVHFNQGDLPFVTESRWVRKLMACDSEMDPYLANDMSNGLMVTFVQKQLGIPVDQDFWKLLEENKNSILEGVLLQDNHL